MAVTIVGRHKESGTERFFSELDWYNYYQTGLWEKVEVIGTSIQSRSINQSSSGTTNTNSGCGCSKKK